MLKKSQVIKILNTGGIGIVATDTIFGLVGQALNKKTVERIYKVRHRSPEKPLIVLISAISDLKLFGVELDVEARAILGRCWPGMVSVILPCRYKKFEYLHRGTNTLAFRLPNKFSILEILKKTGPLVAPSANPEGLSPAKSIEEARKYFGAGVDFYFGQGVLEAPPSTLIKIDKGKIEVLRQGEVVVKN